MALPCILWDLTSPTRDRTSAPTVKAPSPNHWTAREFPVDCSKENMTLCSKTIIECSNKKAWSTYCLTVYYFVQFCGLTGQFCFSGVSWGIITSGSSKMASITWLEISASTGWKFNWVYQLGTLVLLYKGLVTWLLRLPHSMVDGFKYSKMESSTRMEVEVADLRCYAVSLLSRCVWYRTSSDARKGEMVSTLPWEESQSIFRHFCSTTVYPLTRLFTFLIYVKCTNSSKDFLKNLIPLYYQAQTQGSNSYHLNLIKAFRWGNTGTDLWTKMTSYLFHMHSVYSGEMRTGWLQ